MTPWAMLFDGPGRPLRRAGFARPALGPGEALVRVRLCTVCGSDLHTFAGRRTQPTPVVLGHEVVGEVEELGPGGMADVAGHPLAVGDRVVWSVCVSCGGCFFCRRDLPQKCETLWKYGKEPGGLSGGLATHVHLRAGTAAVRVPDGLPDAVAAPAMCAGATVAACLRAAGGVETSDTVLILGAGLLGLTAAAVVKSASGVAVVCDRDNSRLESAVEFGNPMTVLLPDEVADLNDFARGGTTAGGVDAAIELTGGTEPTRLALTLLRTGGTLVLAGAVHPTDPLALDPEGVVRRCLTVRGVHNYTPADLQHAVAWLAGHHARFPFAEQVGRTFPLADADAAFRFAERERPVRVGIVPG